MNDRKPPYRTGLWSAENAKAWLKPMLTADDSPLPRPPEITGDYSSHSERASDGPQPATDAQLDAIAADYAAAMLARGFVIGPPERDAIRRMAAIQDVWRVAFARVIP